MKNVNVTAAGVVLLVLAGAALAGWSQQTSGVTSTLYDIECVGPNQVWTVGADGKILHTTDGGAQWSAQTSGTTNDLYGVDFIDSLNGWAAGSGPVILHTTDGGAQWSPQTAGVSDDLMDITFGSATRGWCSGVNGAIIGTTNGGTSWSREISGIWGWYWGITAASATEAWTIGGDWFNHVSPVYHYNGSSWVHQYDITQDQNGQDISVTGGNILWAVADNGTISRSTNGGASWTPQTSGVTVIINGVDAVSASYCWAVCGGGAILATANGGSNWGPEASGVTNDLFGVSMLDSVNGWACGAGGKILYRTGGQPVEEEHPAPYASRITPKASIVRGELSLRWLGTQSEFAGPNSVMSRAEVRLYDAAGRMLRVLYSGQAQEELVLPLDGIKPGACFVSVSAAGRHDTFRFVKVD